MAYDGAYRVFSRDPRIPASPGVDPKTYSSSSLMPRANKLACLYLGKTRAYLSGAFSMSPYLRVVGWPSTRLRLSRGKHMPSLFAQWPAL